MQENSLLSDFSGKKAGFVWFLRGSSPAGNQAVFQKDRMAAKDFEPEEEAATAEDWKRNLLERRWIC